MPKLLLNLIQVLSLGTTTATTTTTTSCTLLGKAHPSRKRDFAETQEWAPFPQYYFIAEILAAAAAVVQEEDEILLSAML